MLNKLPLPQQKLPHWLPEEVLLQGGINAAAQVSQEPRHCSFLPKQWQWVLFNLTQYSDRLAGQSWFQSKRGGPEYAAYMACRVYETVSTSGWPNYQGAHLQLPSNLLFEEWKALAHMEEDDQLIELLIFSFSTGSMECPDTGNIASAWYFVKTSNGLGSTRPATTGCP